MQISNGAVLCPSSTESIHDIIPVWQVCACCDSLCCQSVISFLKLVRCGLQAHVETTDQNYTNWSMSNNFTLLCLAEGGQGIIQPTLTEVAPGEILALVRTSGCGVIAMSKSYDYGRTFSHPANETSLPNPGAGIDRCARLRESWRVVSCLTACVCAHAMRVLSAIALRCVLLTLVALLRCMQRADEGGSRPGRDHTVQQFAKSEYPPLSGAL